MVALGSFVEAADDIAQLRPILPQLLDEFFKLMNEVESEDLVFTLETIVEKFGEEIAPYAMVGVRGGRLGADVSRDDTRVQFTSARARVCVCACVRV